MNKILCSLMFWGCFRIRHLNAELQRRVRLAAFLTLEGFEFNSSMCFQSGLFCSHSEIVARGPSGMCMILERGDFFPRLVADCS